MASLSLHRLTNTYHGIYKDKNKMDNKLRVKLNGKKLCRLETWKELSKKTTSRRHYPMLKTKMRKLDANTEPSSST